MDVANNLLTIQQKIRAFELQYNRPLHSVTLLAATKGQPIEKIQQAITAGQTIFGENYLQEALEKIEFFKNFSLEWHYIGTIQSNKTRKIAENFAWVHSINHPKICQRLNDQRPVHLPPLNVCIEVNVSHDPNKTGTASQNIFELAELCRSLPRLKLRGLMTIPIEKEALAEQQQEFHKLGELFDKLNSQHFNLDTLSMGMSQDLEAAIAEGATIVRIGTAIFGKRKDSLSTL